MADYKEILGGLIGKAREIAESDAVTGLVSKAKDAVESTGVRSVYEQGASRARSYGQIARLSMGMNSDSSELNKVFTEIGKLYFEQAREAPEGVFVPLFQQAQALMDSMESRREEIRAMKADWEAGQADDIEVEFSDFDEIVNATENDGRGEPKE